MTNDYDLRVSIEKKYPQWVGTILERFLSYDIRGFSPLLVQFEEYCRDNAASISKLSKSNSSSEYKIRRCHLKLCVFRTFDQTFSTPLMQHLRHICYRSVLDSPSACLAKSILFRNVINLSPQTPQDLSLEIKLPTSLKFVIRIRKYRCRCNSTAMLDFA